MKNVVITGGTKGIGKATAILFAENGYRVIATTRNGSQKEALEKDFKQNHNVDIVVEQLDVCNEEDVKKLMHNVAEKYGKLDCVVNNAGIMIENVLLHLSSTEAFRKIIETDVLGVYYGMKYAITEMLKTGGGAIVNVASAAGLIGSKLAGQYGTAKHAVVGLTKCGALDYAENNIRINAVAPGAIKTEIFEEAFKRGAYTEESLASTHPMKRMGLPIEVARSILFLADDKNSFTTGTILSVDGGYIVP